MSCYFNKSYSDPRDQPAPQVKHMQPIKEINPRLMVAAMQQLEMMNQPEMSNTDSITITIQKREPEAQLLINTADQSFKNSEAMGKMMQAQEQMIAQRAGQIMQNELGVRSDGTLDLVAAMRPKRPMY